MFPTITRPLGVVAWLLLVVFLAPSTAWAETAAERMERLNTKGVEAFQEGRFNDAARYFRQANDAQPDPNLRKNEAVAWFKAGNCDEAVPAANAFLIARDTHAEDEREARSIIANCKVGMARKAMKMGSFELADQLLVEAESLDPDDYARDQITMARVDLEAAKRGEGERSGSPATRAVGWSLIGIGAAGAVAGVITHVGAIRAGNELDEGRVDPARRTQLETRVARSRWLVPVLYGVGLGSAGVGLYLVLRGAERNETSVAIGLRGTF